MTKTDTATVEALASAAEARFLCWSLGSRGPEWIQSHAATLRALAAERDKLLAENRELQLQMIANDGQAQEAYEAQVGLKAENERLRGNLNKAQLLARERRWPLVQLVLDRAALEATK